MVPLFLALLVALPVTLPVFAVLEDEDSVQYRDYEALDRIIGGVPATIEEFPFVAGLIYNATNENGTLIFLGCGGTILNKDWVLTVAHCLDFVENQTDVELILVRAGTVNRNEGGVLRSIAESVSHKYPPHDIALLKLNESLPLDGKTIAAAGLPPSNATIPAPSNATILGWGVIDNEGTVSDVLMKKEVVVIGHVYCNETWLFWSYNVSSIKDVEFCTLFDPHETPSHSFQGDSGSPVVAEGQVIGLVSWGSNSTYAPNVHIRVSAYVDWIEEVMGASPTYK